eukprot:scaffold473_cov159-Ochromonas_danica.AAC.11
MKVTELLHLLVILACSQSVVWTDRLSFKNLPPLRCQRPLAALAASVLLCAAPALAQQQLDSIPCATTSVVIAEEPNRKLSDLDSLLSGLLGGAASRASKEVVLHPIDTVKARVQTAQGAVNGSFLSLYGDPALYEKLYDGLIPSLLGGIPAGAVFFGVKDFSKSFLSGALPSWSRPEITALAVVLANVPYWLLRTPSEVVKTQQQVKGRSSSAGGVNKNDVSAWATTLRDGPLMAQAFSSNLLYALPADIIKRAVRGEWTSGGSAGGFLWRHCQRFGPIAHDSGTLNLFYSFSSGLVFANLTSSVAGRVACASDAGQLTEWSEWSRHRERVVAVGRRGPRGALLGHCAASASRCCLWWRAICLL